MAYSNDNVKAQYLEAMGIQRWQLREPVVGVHENVVAEPVTEPYVAEGSAPALGWPALEARVAGCMDCELHCQRSQSVLGAGARNADWLIVGEAPGADEDKQGEPFVGPAGQLLNQMLLAIGLKREQVYITNVVKCRPPEDRDPKKKEAASCELHLRQQIELLQPKIILAVGLIAAKNMLKLDQRMADMRGQRFEYADTGIPVVTTYHPAYLLRSPSEKRKAWEDLLFARQITSSNH